MAKKLTSLDGMIFGMPPGTHISDDIIKNSMPIASITPCEGKPSKGTHLMELEEGPGWKKYIKILESVGFSLSNQEPIRVAFQADAFPTDTFQNEYGETIFERMSSGISSATGDISQIMGLDKMSDVEAAVDSLSGVLPTVKGKSVSDLKNKMKTMKGELGSSFRKKNKQLGNAFDQGMAALAVSATGGRVDYPKVWKNSSFNPSYTMTIRLWNPDPSNPESTRKYIVGPIAAILSLALPKAGDSKISSYKWPLLCKVHAPGIYNLNTAYISSVSIIKGGDSLNIGYNQAMKLCDVRIDFQSMFNSILSGGDSSFDYKRPTFATYLDAIGGHNSKLNLESTKDVVNTDSSWKDKNTSWSQPERPSLKEAVYAEGFEPNAEPVSKVSDEDKETEKSFFSKIADFFTGD